MNLFCGLYDVLMCSYPEVYREVRGVGNCRFKADGRMLLGLKISEGRKATVGTPLVELPKGGNRAWKGNG